jgi:hypothetical protein
MAKAPVLDKLFALMQIKKPPKGPLSISTTFHPAAPTAILPILGYQDHLQSLSDVRLQKDARDLLQYMFWQDPDVSAAVNAYLTMADTRLTMVVRDLDQQIDPTATATLNQLVNSLFRVTDLQDGFQLKANLQQFCQELRWMLLLRGAVGGELIFDKNLVPTRIQQFDMKTIFWYETEDGVNKPEQRVPGAQSFIELDLPSVFISFYRRDPTQIYAQSQFVSVINTAAARTQVINELYRIMQVTGYPRIGLKVVEDVLVKHAPINIRDDPNQLATWAATRLQEIGNGFSGMRSDQPFAHFDSVEPSMINDKNPGAGMDITSVIEVLNAQNQAALKTMATVIGRGNAGVNTASVEARIAAMNADQLNAPVKNFLDQALTFLINVYGIQGFVDSTFAPAELRPRLELEPQMVLKQSRLLQDLSLGNISDEEYCIEMFGRLPLAGAPPLSGTGFQAVSGANAQDVTPNGDPLGRSLSGEGTSAKSMTKSNSVKQSLQLLLQQ